jgi:hypothetical protein
VRRSVPMAPSTRTLYQPDDLGTVRSADGTTAASPGVSPREETSDRPASGEGAGGRGAVLAGVALLAVGGFVVYLFQYA